MNSPRKAPRTSRNQPADFHQSLTASLPLDAFPAEPTAVAAPGLTSLQARAGLAVIWVLASLAGGIGIGMAILDSQTPSGSGEAPVPVAAAPVAVTEASANATAQLPISLAAPASLPGLAVVPAAALAQASGGITQTTAGTGKYQQTGGPDSLQPGYIHFGRPQGNIGTPAVR